MSKVASTAIMRRPALLVIDMLNDFFDESYGDSTLATLRFELVGTINQLIGVLTGEEEEGEEE